MRNCTLLVVVATIAAAGSIAFAQVGDDAMPTDAAAIIAKGDKLVADIHGRVEQLLPGSPHELFTRHLRSTDAVTRADWLGCRLVVDTDRKMVERSLGFYQKVLEGLGGDAGKWDSYAAGERSLLLAYVSKVDQTMHAYHLRLPRDWDAAKAYPTIVYLHGHVPNVHSMWYYSLPFSAEEPKPSEALAELPPHFVLAPWGRGNGGYDGPAERDVWEAIADASSRVKFDAERQYLTGHSMGGFGTWRIATRTPDHWAAVAIYAGGQRDADPDLAGNLANTPVLLWHGAKDRTIPLSSMRSMQEALKRFGNEAKIDVDDQAGHMVPSGAKTPHQKWLLEQVRKRPDKFGYLAESSSGRGAWGIALPRARGGAMPKFTCRIDGQTVHIDSENAGGLDVQLGPDGLRMTGDVVIMWNGKEAYRGPVTKEPVKLGTGARSRRY